MQPPPATLDGATVLAYAEVDGTIRYTGALHLYHGETRVGPVPRLAICQDPAVDGMFLFHCDDDWNVLGAQIWNQPADQVVRTITEVKEKAERYYTGITAKWISA